MSNASSLLTSCFHPGCRQSTAKAFNISYNALEGPFPRFLYKELPVTNEPYCNPANQYEGGCNIQIKLTGNNLLCPRLKSEHGMTDGEFAALESFTMGCVSNDGKVYEVSSVLRGDPKLLEDAQVTAETMQAAAAVAAEQQAQQGAVAAAIDPIAQLSSGNNVLGDGKGGMLVRQKSQDSQGGGAQSETESNTARNSGSTSSSSDSSGSKQQLPIGALVGIIVGATVGGCLLILLLVVVVYRRRFSGRPERNYGAGPNRAGAITGPLESTIGPLAATTPGAVCSSAPIKGGAPVVGDLDAPRDAAATVAAVRSLGGDHMV
jgi:hypothetical protein